MFKTLPGNTQEFHEKINTLGCVLSAINQRSCFKGAKVNKHPPEHHAGWMVCGQETLFGCIPVP
jgi:hypothetical protein